MSDDFSWEDVRLDLGVAWVSESVFGEFLVEARWPSKIGHSSTVKEQSLIRLPRRKATLGRTFRHVSASLSYSEAEHPHPSVKAYSRRQNLWISCFFCQRFGNNLHYPLACWVLPQASLVYQETFFHEISTTLCSSDSPTFSWTRSCLKTDFPTPWSQWSWCCKLRKVFVCWTSNPYIIICSKKFTSLGF